MVICLSKAAEKSTSSSAKAVEKAEALFKEQHWAEARAAYDEARLRESDWTSPRVRMAVEGAVTCSMKLAQWDDVLRRAQEFITKTEGSFEEAVGHRFLAGLYLTIPHEGTKQGTTYLRGQWTQGVRVSSFRKDRKEAIAHYERARELLIAMRGKMGTEKNPDTADRRKLLTAEQIGVHFDLAAALARRDPYGYGRWGWAGWWWGAFEAEEEFEAVEEADYEEARWGRGWNPDNQTPPTGIPLDNDGKPKFIETPKEYSRDLGDGPKIRFLLDEIQRLDTTEKKEDAARALFRWAMIARTLYGPETAQQWSGSRVNDDRLGRPLPQTESDQPKKKMWELKDDEALTMVGGRLQVVVLPAAESPMALLKSVEEKYPQSGLRPEAAYARALYLQTRQQFPQAIGEYRELIQRFSDHRRATDARGQIEVIEKAEVQFGAGSVHLPDTKPKLSFTYRNTGTIELTAFEFDLLKYLQDQMEDKSENYWHYRDLNWRLFGDQKQQWKKYQGKETAAWTEKVKTEEGNRVAEGFTLAPLPKPGAYLVEAKPAGTEAITRVVVLVSDVAIVEKNLVGKGLIYVCDARTGQPIADKAVRVYEHWQEWIQTKQKSELYWESSIQTTNKDGVIEYKRKHGDRSSNVDAVVVGEGGRMAFSFFQNWSENDPGYYFAEEGPRDYVVTDRPVYRPGQTVKFRVWMRSLVKRAYQPPTQGASVSLTMYDAKNNEVKTWSLPLDQFGCASGEFELGDEPPLGVYHFRVNGRHPDARHLAGALFRVEEYKKPEFEVTVKPAKRQARLGEKVKARIEARYYFGAPVAKGKVTYKVFRENYNHVYWGEAEYDWLYGKGYGRYYYAYPWFPWWGRWGCFICCDSWLWPVPYWGKGWYFPWGYYGEQEQWGRRYESGTRKALRDLVAQGTDDLKDDGSYEIEIDTARAKAELGDRDHRYTVEAEVRDESRRTIEGQGSVLVTRQEFYAFIETNGGWYQPQNEAFVQVRTLTPDNVPVAAKGEVIVKRIRYGGADNSEVQEEIVKRWEAETDAEGRLSFRYPVPGEGQYRITFVTQDSWKEEVQGNAVFWVAGPKFDGRVYRFNDLEIIADKRTYKVGDTAHLLINTETSNCRLLFSENVARGVLLDYRFINMQGRSMVVDIAVEARHVPNFFVEATTVRDGRMIMESQEMFVPPVKGMLNVKIETDRQTYKPGDKGKVRVAVTDTSGEPVAGQVTLTAYDEAVTYIQDEFGPNPRVFFYGQKRYHTPSGTSSVSTTFGVSGVFTRAEHMTYQGGEPDGWRGTWGLETEGLSLNGMDKEKAEESARFEDRYSRRAGNEPMGGPGGGGGGYGGGASAAKPSSAPADMLASSIRGVSGSGLARDEAKRLDVSNPEPAGRMVEPEIRTNFADTALWAPSLIVGQNGTTETEIIFPQSLTTWRLRAYALTNATQVGDATAHTTTTKNLLVRLQAPRFFVERDEVVLSANVHNYLKTEKKVIAELVIPADLFELLETDKTPLPDKEGNLHVRAQANVKPNSEHRFDWPVKVKKQGLARITVKALTDEESDGMRMAFPVLVHGINKTVAQNGSFRVTEEGDRPLKVDLPKEIDPEQTRLEVTLSPSLAGVMIDALPYLVGYPYGCIEQTMSRFYPTILVAGTLKKMGTDLETVGKQRKQMNAGDLKNRFGQWQNPVFDTDEMNRMIRAGLDRIYSFQRNDGGWGWWREDDSSPFQTAYVLQGLRATRDANLKDIRLDGGVYDRGMQFLQNLINIELAKPVERRLLGDLPAQAYMAYVLSLENRLGGEREKKWLDELYTSRTLLTNYGRAQLALAMHNMKREDEAKTLLRNLLQFVDRDDSNETAWVRTPGQYWWFWWNNDIETNAWALKAIVILDPKNDLAPRIVKWLLNNRRNGYYWRSTRDTAQVIAALCDYMTVSGESVPDYNLVVTVDGKPMREVKVTKENFFSFDNRVALYGLQIKPGPHEVVVSKKGGGALYYSCYLSYFTLEEDIKGAGNEILIQRQYFKLEPATENVNLPDKGIARTAPAGRPKPLDQTGRTEQRAIYRRIPLNSGDAVKSGDKIEVVLTITAKNTYDYLVFEDMKAAGCEPMELRSGGRWAGGLCANLELRDEKVVFFIGLLEQGTHVLRYKLRAETPGTFHALPASGHAMYAPEVRAISDEMRLGIRE